MKHRYLSFLFLFMCVLFAHAQFNKSSYYKSADGKKGSALKTALAGCISSHTTISYDGLLECYKTTDVTPEGYIWDMYSNTTRYVPGGPKENKSYKGEGDSYNREHSVPQSWFNEASPMKSDLYHVVPTDGYVNNRRSNYDYGEVGSVKYQSNGGFSKMGSPTSQLEADGCSEQYVFEPNDMYKGDFARIYFYMVTCYESRIKSWSGSGMLNQTTYPAFTEWARKLLLRWSKTDMVSEKETNRVEAVYSFQKNRNPFVDFPGLEEYVWGTWKDSLFSVNNYRNPYDYDPTDQPDTPDPDTPDTPDPDDPDDETDNVPEGDYALVSNNLSNWDGIYLIAYTDEDDKTCVFDGGLKTLDANDNVLTVSVTDNVIKASERVDNAAYRIKAEGTAGYHAVQSVATGQYIGKTSKKNGLEVATSYSADMGNKIAVYNGVATLTSSCGYQLRFNATANRFRYYSAGSQMDIKLFRKAVKETDDISLPDAEDLQDAPIYDLQGRRLQSIPAHGVYIKAGRKYMR